MTDNEPADGRGRGPVVSGPLSSRLTAGLILLGAAGQVPLGILHPHQAQPNDSRAAFIEYASADSWAEVHLGQYVGALLVAFGLVALAVTMAQRPGAAGQLARFAGVTAVVSAAVFAVQMAVDGVALKAAVEQWTSAPAGQQAPAYGVAEVIRSLEKGLSALFHLNNGIALVALGSAVLVSQQSRALGLLGLAAGVGFLATSVVTARTGFSPEAASVAQLPTLLLAAFLIGTALVMWRGVQPSSRRSAEARS